MDAEQLSDAALGNIWNMLSQAQRRALVNAYYDRDTTTNKIISDYRSQTLSSKALSGCIDQKAAGYTGSFYIKPLGIALAEFVITKHLIPQQPIRLVKSSNDIEKTATMNDLVVATNDRALADSLVADGYVEVGTSTYNRHASFLMSYYRNYFETKAEA